MPGPMSGRTYPPDLSSSSVMSQRPRDDYELSDVSDDDVRTGAPSPWIPSSDYFSPLSPATSMTKGPYQALSVGERSMATPSGSPDRAANDDKDTVFGRVRSAERKKVWGTGVHWYMPGLMVFVFACGVLGAAAHHLFYDSLDGKPAHDQLTMVRYGTALAFFTKASLVGSVVIAYRQRIWYTLRRKTVTIKGIDSLFGVVEDPSWFMMSTELYRKAKIATGMAAATWLIPLAAVFSPGSLTADLTNVYASPMNCSVPSLNFSAENTANWRKPRVAPGYSLAFFNVTPPLGVDGKIDWYDQPSKNLNRLTTLTVLSGDAISIKDSPCSEFNCTYTLNFAGPWYNCSEKTYEEAKGAPVKFEDLAPQGDLVYYAKSDEAEYTRPQLHYNDTDYFSQGYFAAEPTMWIGYVIDTKQPAEKSSPWYKNWNTTLERRVLQCVHQKVTYTLGVDFTNGRGTYSFKNITNGVPLLPQGAGGMSPNSTNYKEYAGYHALGTLARNYLNGYIIQASSSAVPVTASDISQTKLITRTTSFAVPEFLSAMETWYEQIVASLLTEPFLEIAITETVPCQRTRYENRFNYHRRNLWIGYAISVATALISIIIGGLSIHANGISSDITFSKILVTTRNRTLDNLVQSYQGVCLGADPFPKEIERTELVFGVIDERRLNPAKCEECGHDNVPASGGGDDAGEKRKHAAFGLKAETIPILRGDGYGTLSRPGGHYQASSSWLPGSEVER